ncbi:MAG: zinc ribbon domain-containing protein [Clostridia bacterium]|nr:zinc ribbon domain-containing protein [Clostridia bacterium]
MYCVRCGAEIKGRYCSNCGTKVEEEKKSDQQQLNTSENVMKNEVKDNQETKTNILVRSKNCTQLVEETKKANDKGSTSYLTTVSIIGIIAMFLPYLFAAMDGKKMAYAKGLPLPMVILIMVMLFIAWMFFSKQTKIFRELYDKYREYCSTEVLVADEYKIYGSTTKGEIKLSYDQIESVKFSPNRWQESERKPIIPNDIFTVRDIAGNEFVFYSFSNCNELKTVIDMQMRSGQR